MRHIHTQSTPYPLFFSPSSISIIVVVVIPPPTLIYRSPHSPLGLTYSLTHSHSVCLSPTVPPIHANSLSLSQSSLHIPQTNILTSPIPSLSNTHFIMTFTQVSHTSIITHYSLTILSIERPEHIRIYYLVPLKTR